MTYAIAAAGTGGHVFPALAVGEALVDLGVPRSDVIFVGGSRLEATAVPAAGFPFHPVEIRGLQRSMAPSNLLLPFVVIRAIVRMRTLFAGRGVRALLGVGGYVTPPAVIAARLAGAATMISEQNAEAGLGNRMAARLCRDVFGSFPQTGGLPSAEWVGNPVRRPIAMFDREELRREAMARYELDPSLPVVGVFGGSLGAGPINDAISDVVAGWSSDHIQVLHLAGNRFVEEIQAESASATTTWRLIGFEERMELFYAASDLVVARAGGAVAELAATRTPAVLIPGGFGSGNHQWENARVFSERGAAVVLEQTALAELGPTLERLIAEPERLERMRSALDALSRPDAASVIASKMRERHG